MKPTLFALLFLASSVPAFAQTEQALRTFFEGKTVVLRIDMPATSMGVDVENDAARAVDFKQYGDRLKAYGTSLRTGDSTIVTLVRVKDKNIEFQLGGGGFGTFGDDTSTSVYVPGVGKSTREKNLERDIKNEADSGRKRRMQEELDGLRKDREREDRRNQAVAKDAEEAKKARVAEQRLQGGSRFNLRFPAGVPRGVAPEDLMAALAEFVDFSGGPRPVVAPAALSTASGNAPAARASVGTLRKGLTREEAEALLGAAESTTQRKEGILTVVTAIFLRGDERIEAQFVEGVLFRYAISSK